MAMIALGTSSSRLGGSLSGVTGDGVTGVGTTGVMEGSGPSILLAKYPKFSKR